MRFVSLLAAAAAVALPFAALPTAALADESWSFGTMQVYWESDMPDGAVFAVTDTSDGTEGRIYVKGLTADQTERGTYKAIWVAYDDDQVCDEPLTDPEGKTTSDWGTMTITFTTPEFPYSWDAKVGTCKGAQEEEISMTPPN